MTEQKVIQIWGKEGLSDLRGPVYSQKRQNFLNGMTVLKWLQRAFPDNEALALQLIGVIEETRNVRDTLLAACQAAEVESGSDSKISAEKTFIARKNTEAAEFIRTIKKNLETALAQQKFESQKVSQWLEKEGKVSSQTVPTEGKNAEEHLILEPLFYLYTHLKSSIKTTLAFPDKEPKVVSPSALTFLLKNATEKAERKALFGALSSCFASHSSVFGDVLNAVSGAHLLTAERAGKTPLTYSLESEGLQSELYIALKKVYTNKLSEIQDCLRFMGTYIDEQDDSKQEKFKPIPVSLLGAPLAEYKVSECLSTYEASMELIEKTIAPLFPRFGYFLELCRKGKWIETRNYSGGIGGAWAADVPIGGAVAVYVDFHPNLHRIFELAHTLGEAFLRWNVLSTRSYNPSTVTFHEFFGRMFEELLLRNLMDSEFLAEDEKRAILWHALRRIVINLLQIPFRFFLTEAIFKERRRGYLSVERLNELTRESWNYFYGDLVSGVDQYIWIRKPHFYRTTLLHHDFQYTVGYLCANRLLRALQDMNQETWVKKGSEILYASVAMDLQGLFKTTLNLDLHRESFWEEAICEALLPLEEIKRFSNRTKSN